MLHFGLPDQQIGRCGTNVIFQQSRRHSPDLSNRPPLGLMLFCSLTILQTRFIFATRTDHTILRQTKRWCQMEFVNTMENKPTNASYVATYNRPHLYCYAQLLTDAKFCFRVTLARLAVIQPSVLSPLSSLYSVGADKFCALLTCCADKRIVQTKAALFADKPRGAWHNVAVFHTQPDSSARY